MPRVRGDGDGQQKYWSDEEHDRYCKAVEIYGWRSFKEAAEYVGTRSLTQIRTHFQKYSVKIQAINKAVALASTDEAYYYVVDMVFATLCDATKALDGQLSCQPGPHEIATVLSMREQFLDYPADEIALYFYEILMSISRSPARQRQYSPAVESAISSFAGRCLRFIISDPMSLHPATRHCLNQISSFWALFRLQWEVSPLVLLLLLTKPDERSQILPLVEQRGIINNETAQFLKLPQVSEWTYTVAHLLRLAVHFQEHVQRCPHDTPHWVAVCATDGIDIPLVAGTVALRLMGFPADVSDAPVIPPVPAVSRVSGRASPSLSPSPEFQRPEPPARRRLKAQSQRGLLKPEKPSSGGFINQMVQHLPFANMLDSALAIAPIPSARAPPVTRQQVDMAAPLLSNGGAIYTYGQVEQSVQQALADQAMLQTLNLANGLVPISINSYASSIPQCPVSNLQAPAGLPSMHQPEHASSIDYSSGSALIIPTATGLPNGVWTPIASSGPGLQPLSQQSFGSTPTSCGSLSLFSEE